MSKRVECQNLSIGKEIGGKECLKELSVDRYQLDNIGGGKEMSNYWIVSL